MMRLSPAPPHRPPAPPADSAAGRLQFLDGLRGVAALAVVVQHIGEVLSPAFTGWTAHAFQGGQFGVMLFFLSSGFIIPRSLLRRASLRSFWIGRFFRLYPLYWISLAGALALSALGRLELPAAFQTSPVWSALANATMLHTFLGVPNALGPYWTLAFEMTFYALVTLAFVVRVLHRPFLLACAALLGCLVLGAVVPAVTGRQTPLALFNLATMFVGYALQACVAGGAGARSAALLAGSALTTGVLVLMANLTGREDAAAGGTRSIVPMATAWVAAYAVFGVTLAARRLSVPQPAAYLGKISYSIYLLHPLVIALVPAGSGSWGGWGAAATAALWLVATLAVSAAAYHAVELPCIALGNRLAGRPVPAARAAL